MHAPSDQTQTTGIQDDRRALLGYYSSNQLQWAGIMLVAALAVFQELSLLSSKAYLVPNLVIASLPATLFIVFSSGINLLNWTSQLQTLLAEPNPEGIDPRNDLRGLDDHYTKVVKQRVFFIRRLAWQPVWLQGLIIATTFLTGLVVSFALT